MGGGGGGGGDRLNFLIYTKSCTEKRTQKECSDLNSRLNTIYFRRQYDVIMQTVIVHFESRFLRKES